MFYQKKITEVLGLVAFAFYILPGRYLRDFQDMRNIFEYKYYIKRFLRFFSELGRHRYRSAPVGVGTKQTKLITMNIFFLQLFMRSLRGTFQTDTRLLLTWTGTSLRPVGRLFNGLYRPRSLESRNGQASQGWFVVDLSGSVSVPLYLTIVF